MAFPQWALLTERREVLTTQQDGEAVEVAWPPSLGETVTIDKEQQRG